MAWVSGSRMAHEMCLLLFLLLCNGVLLLVVFAFLLA